MVLFIRSLGYFVCVIWSLCAADSLSMLGNYNGTSLTAVISSDLSEHAASRQYKSCNIHQRCLPTTSLCILAPPPSPAAPFTCHSRLWGSKRLCKLFKGSFGKQDVFVLYGIRAALNFALLTLLCSQSKKARVHPVLLVWETWILCLLSLQVCILFRVGELCPFTLAPQISIWGQFCTQVGFCTLVGFAGLEIGTALC